MFYSERPKFIFAITPPHLQQYQKHILVIIKQIIDEIYANSYVTKPTRKPIVGTRLMLEEFGVRLNRFLNNIRVMPDGTCV